MASAMAIITLALAAGELVRIGVEPLRLRAEADQLQQLHDARARPALARRPCAASATSLICCSIVCSGLSEVIGSWKIIAMRSPRILAQARLGVAPTSSWPVKRDRAAGGWLAERIGQELQDRERRHRLAGAGLADQRQGLALAEGEEACFYRFRTARLAACRKRRSLVRSLRCRSGRWPPLPGRSCGGRRRRAPPRR